MEIIYVFLVGKIIYKRAIFRSYVSLVEGSVGL